MDSKLEYQLLMLRQAMALLLVVTIEEQTWRSGSIERSAMLREMLDKAMKLANQTESELKAVFE